MGWTRWKSAQHLLLIGLSMSVAVLNSLIAFLTPWLPPWFPVSECGQACQRGGALRAHVQSLTPWAEAMAIHTELSSRMVRMYSPNSHDCKTFIKNVRMAWCVLYKTAWKENNFRVLIIWISKVATTQTLSTFRMILGRKTREITQLLHVSKCIANYTPSWSCIFPQCSIGLHAAADMLTL